MNRSSFALFVALLIHFILLLIFWLLGSMTPEIKKPVQPKEERIKVSLKEMPKKIKDSGLTKPEPKPVEIAPPMPKGEQLKELEKAVKTKHIKKPLIKYEEKIIEQEPKFSKLPINKSEPIPVAEPTPKTEPLPPTKPYIPMPQQSTKKYDSLEWLNEDKSVEEVKDEKKIAQSGSNINSDIKELYGSDFGKLSPGQQKYILDNQEIMRRITQQVLNRVARVNLTRDLNINRVNIIEFYLHPNGDMTDFKFLKASGYYILDRTTQETIEYAYSRYPRPAEKTLIRYNVFYNLAVH